MQGRFRTCPCRVRVIVGVRSVIGASAQPGPTLPTWTDRVSPHSSPICHAATAHVPSTIPREAVSLGIRVSPPARTRRGPAPRPRHPLRGGRHMPLIRSLPPSVARTVAVIIAAGTIPAAAALATAARPLPARAAPSTTIAPVGALPAASPALDIAHAGRHAYVAAHGRGVHVVDVSDPAHPRLVATAATAGAAYDVAVAGDRLYVAAWSAGLEIHDISDPAAPRKLGAVPTRANAQAVAVGGTVAYVGDWSAVFDGPDPEYGVVALDVADPAAPRAIGHLNTPGWAGDLALDGSTLYVADGPGGLRVLDVADPTRPREIAALPTAVRAYGIDHAADRLYIADNTGGLRLVDVADPAVPTDLGGLTFGGGAAYGVAAAGDRAWVALADGGGPADAGRVALVDVSDPRRPVALAEHATPQRAWGVDVDAAGRAFVAATGSGIVVLAAGGGAAGARVYLPQLSLGLAESRPTNGR
ncbi:hypothetical protein DCC79_11695 [bacterium]|nr:MAG: hypothetical protein DCC79_11695 [bacterium]